MPRGKRRRLATGIYQDVYGRTIIVKVHGVQYERRYAPDTPLEELRKHRRALREEKAQLPARSPRGTLNVDFTQYLERFAKGTTARQNARILIDHWRDAGFGSRAPGTVTPLEIETQLARWVGRFKPKTLNDLRRTLAAVYTARNGKTGENPVRDVPRRRVVYDDPRGQAYSLIHLVLEHMPDRGKGRKDQPRSDVSLTKARLLVMAYTGLHQAEIARLTAADLRELDQKRLWVGGRRKGAGTKGGWHPLTSHGVAALKAFAAAQAFGPISTSAMAKSWRRAVNAAKKTWADTHPDEPWPAPDNWRVYDIRHAFGSAIYHATGDIRAAQRLMRHASITSTLRYTASAVDPRAQAAADAMEHVWPTASRLPSSDGKPLQNPPPPGIATPETALANQRPQTRRSQKRAKK